MSATAISSLPVVKPEQFQEKCETAFRPELRQNKELERFAFRNLSVATPAVESIPPTKKGVILADPDPDPDLGRGPLPRRSPAGLRT
jgi:hypothetical protein